MTERVFDEYAYGNGPRDGCWWDETCYIPACKTLHGDVDVDVAIVGAGYTGLSAALGLARKGVSVAVLEAQTPGWGASGRNGGFCCLGGGIASDRELNAQFGRDARLHYRNAEKQAVAFVEDTIVTYGIEVDRHSIGETELAHRPKDMAALRTSAQRIPENYGVSAHLIEQGALAEHGFGGGPFFGAMTVPIGFGLNPRKYYAGLLSAAQKVGASVFAHSSVGRISKRAGGWRLDCGAGRATAQQVIVATNGYSSENLPDWLAGRYMPCQSTVLVTRPLTQGELEDQGWTTRQMSYDTRNLLHYFRLMPDHRFLFGMRGALRTGPRAEAAARRKTRFDFERTFPRWASVESTHTWSGFVNLARNKVPFVGAVPHAEGLWAAMCYHGNGVAMGSYAGKLVADAVLGDEDEARPAVMKKPLGRFPFGRARRAIMPPLYASLKYSDYF